VVLAILGFWVVDVKLFGPVQLYVAPAMADAVKLKVEPTHNGLFALTVGVAGNGLTNTVRVVSELVHPNIVDVTE
jgi:hypothetical protein